MASDRGHSHVGRLFRYQFYRVLLRIGVVVGIMISLYLAALVYVWIQ